MTSDAAPVTVRTPRVVIGQPLGCEPCRGAALSLSVSAAGSALLSYQCRRGEVPLAGATAATENLDPAQAGEYDVVVTNDCGSVISPLATLTVHQGPVITAASQSQGVCPAGTMTLAVVATGSPPLSYCWRHTGVVPAETGPTLKLVGVGPADAGAYDVRISGGCGDTVSPVAMWTLATGPRIVAPPQAGMVPAGSAVTLRVTAERTTPLQYQWRHAEQQLPGATQAELVLSAVRPTDAGLYDAVVTNACGGVTSLAAELVVVGDDNDGDGVRDAANGCPNDPSKVGPGVCGCGRSDADSDGDGVADCVDRCAGTPAGMPVGADGCAAGDCDRNGLGRRAGGLGPAAERLTPRRHPARLLAPGRRARRDASVAAGGFGW